LSFAFFVQLPNYPCGTKGLPLFIGVDIGGTKVAAGLVTADGEIQSQLRLPMPASGSAQEGLDAVLSAINGLAAGAGGVLGIGICSPGPLDPGAGMVLNPPNLPCWRNFPLADAVQNACGLPVLLDNDANAAALAEAKWGAARGYSIVFYVTVGTGIGAGIIFDGNIYHGRTGAAAEGGHVSIDHRGPLCACGKPGCIEMLASGPAIARRAKEKLSEAQSSLMLQMAGGSVASITAELVGQAATAGDPIANQVLAETARFIALWLGNIVDLLDPHVIVIGGGAAAMLKPFHSQIIEWLPKYSVNPRAHEVPVLQARYGRDSGIAGGAALCAFEIRT
jgi:glucokinase